LNYFYGDDYISYLLKCKITSGTIIAKIREAPIAIIAQIIESLDEKRIAAYF